MNPKIAPNITQPDNTFFQARVWSRGNEYSRAFSFKQWGSKAKALVAAKSWRDQIKTAYKTGSRRLNNLRKDNTSGVLGVRYDESFSAAKGLIQCTYSACWTDYTGKLKNKTFYIGNENTWTQEKDNKAFAAACAFRSAWEEATDNNRLEQFDSTAFNGWQ